MRASSIILLFSFPVICYSNMFTYDNIPIVINTWNFTRATDKAWLVLNSSGTALDAVEYGASVCEYLQCDGTVGYGGSPDEHGETTLDALIMDGKTMNVGAVGNLRQIKHAISVARKVLENTKHSILVGELASNFAVMMGFTKETLTTNTSKEMWKGWKKNNCQPNFWQNVKPNPESHCGPYTNHKTNIKYIPDSNRYINEFNHDTIGMVAIDYEGHIAAGTSTNGAKFKIPGRIGDSPIPGSGAYADDEVGGAAATGDGDIMLRFLPSLLAVEEMRRGSSPEVAAQVAIARIVKYYPSFFGGVIAVSKIGVHGAACNGMKQFPYAVHDFFGPSRIIYVNC